jgi:hypothetical protein
MANEEPKKQFPNSKRPASDTEFPASEKAPPLTPPCPPKADPPLAEKKKGGTDIRLAFSLYPIGYWLYPSPLSTLGYGEPTRYN